MQRTNTVVGLLRVTMVGVALSATPIFNSAHAQQSRNQTNLLLEVQSLRQEIAELRDMVERQQFQMRKLQRQISSQTPANGAQQGYANRPTGNYPDTNVPPAQGKPNFQGSNGPGSNGPDYGTNPEYQPATRDVGDNRGAYPQGAYQQPGSADGVEPVIDEAANGNYRSQQGQGQQGVEERVINAPPLDRSQAGGNFPPVVDRSIGRPVQNVPITGEGASANDSRVLTAPRDTQANSRVYSQDLPAPDSQTSRAPAYPTQGGGVVSVPANGSISANQIPVNPNAQTASTGSQPATGAQPTSDSAAGGLSEVEFYNQGFELLKQSKYEEAATIFEQQIAAYPRGDRADDAHYWISEAMHVSRKLDVAKVHLKKIINDFPQSNRLPDAMLKTAYIEQSQGNQIEARILFQEIVNYHPKSDAAIAAKNQLASAE